LRESAPQLWPADLGVATFGLVAWFWGRARSLPEPGSYSCSETSTGPYFRRTRFARTRTYRNCTWFAWHHPDILQASVSSRASPVQAISLINLVSLGLACSISGSALAIIFTEPDLASISSIRFVISEPWRYWRDCIFAELRGRREGEEAHVDLCEALYHFGVVLAIWCGALLVPWFQAGLHADSPSACPPRLFLPSRGTWNARRTGSCPALLQLSFSTGFVVLGLYLFKGIFHMIVFPHYDTHRSHHYKAAGHAARRVAAALARIGWHKLAGPLPAGRLDGWTVIFCSPGCQDLPV